MASSANLVDDALLVRLREVQDLLHVGLVEAVFLEDCLENGLDGGYAWH